jgi:hypothetical protein
MISTASPDTPVNPGKNRFGFALSSPANNSLVTGGNPQVYLAKDQTSKAVGPFGAQWFPLSGYDQTGDRSPRSPIAVGVFVVELDVPGPGTWLVTATTDANGQRGVADPNSLTVVSGPLATAAGAKAISTPTPVATTDAKIAAICTREPVCHMHAISLDDALRDGRPTVAGFATPLLCESQLCGPVIDEQILASQRFGSKANFIHVEEFLPGPDHTPPAPSLQTQSPAFKAWHLTTEPWVFVIDRKGVIRFSANGPVAAPEIEAAVESLL